MPSYVTPKKNTAYVTSVTLPDQANVNKYKLTPTLAAGDVKVSIDNGALANITTLPVETPAGSGIVKVSLSATEMDGDTIDVLFADAAGDEWSDVHLPLATTAKQIDDLSVFDSTTDQVTANIIQISGSTVAATNLSKSAVAIEPAEAIAGTLSTTQMTTDLTETTDDHYNGRIIIWTTGNLKNQATDITAYTGSSKMLTYTATTEAPTATDEFVIL